MNNLILYTAIILFLLGLIFCIWSIFHIRKKHYDDYIKRKR